MKKRIVAIMLSLTMCLSMAAEASAASEAEFAAEADASDVAVIDDAEAESPSDNTADVDSEEAASDDVQIDMGADEDANADAVDITDETEPDFDAFSAEGEKTEISFEEQDVTACTEDTAVQTLNEVVKDNEASLSYTRWKSENGKWKLEKPPVSVNPAVQTAETSEADAVTDENAVEDEAFLVDEDTQDIQNEETADASEEDITEDTIDVQDMPETAEQKETAEDVQDGETAEQTTSDYFTDKDGIVKVTALKNNGDEICTAYYAFDENGYMLTGRSKVLNDYYYFKAANEVKVTGDLDTDQKTPYNSELGQRIIKTWKWNTADKAFNYYGDAGKQTKIAANKIYTINKQSYFLLDGGKPYVGMRTVNKAVYYFRKASNANDIPGKMVRNAWASATDKKGTMWRYFGSDGRYQKKGTGAYKILSNSSNSYLLDANGYLIKGKMVKAANNYYYLSNKYGAVYKNRLVKYGNRRYYFVSDGRRGTWRNRWIKCPGAGNRYYYFGRTAGCIDEKHGIQKVTVNGKFMGWYYFSSNGNILFDRWVSDRYYKADGSMASGVTKIGNKYYFFQRSSETAYRGKVYKSQWIKFNNKYYCASSSGALYVNGWRRISCGGQKYYFYFKNCVALTNRRIKRGDTYGTLDERGRFIEAGWVVVNSSRNLVRYMDPKTGKYVFNTVKVINGIQYRFDKRGYRVNDRTGEIRRSKYYLSCDRVNGVMTVYANRDRTIPIKTIRVSVGNPGTPTPKGTYSIKRAGRWQPLMGPSWGQYGSWVVGGIYVHSVACSEMNDHNLPVGEYLKLGNPASHGCIRCCVADAKWVYDNCNGSEITIFDGVYQSNEARKGPLGRKALTPLRGSKNFDPTDPAYN